MREAQKIRIDDLREPVLTPAQRAGLAFGEKTPISLTPDSVLDAASLRTGSPTSARTTFRERLALWLSEMDEDPERTGLGRASLWNDCVRCAANRLRIHALLSEHPEIRDVAIARPIIVVGLPRSGTTHLVNLIAADARLRSLPLWESQEPVPDPREAPGADGVDPRYARSAKGWEMMRATCRCSPRCTR
jgi:hypothetical protein